MHGINSQTLAVGIGASAGGLAALEDLFSSLEEKLNTVFFVVQHLSPNHESRMTGILSRKTKIPIIEATSSMPIQAGQIYLVSPNTTMQIEKHNLKVDKREPSPGPSFPINMLFSSLAKEFGDRAVAVVLSGTGSDGTHGAIDVSLDSGEVIAQSAASCLFDSMPHSVIQTGVVGFIGNPYQISKYLETICTAVASEPAFEELGNELDDIFKMISEKYGLDLSKYRKSTLNRRISAQMQKLNYKSIEKYIHFLERNEQQVESLYQDILIGITSFFRRPEAFKVLESKLEAVFKKIPVGGQLKVWIAACSTGEEVYTLAMLLSEYIESYDLDVKVKIFATDINGKSLEFAAQGIYTEDAIETISNDLKSKYFIREHGKYKAVPSLRKMVLFSKHDLTSSAPFRNIHILLCRNMLIYLQSKWQKDVLSYFLYSLKIDGLLMLGNSESLCGFDRYFAVVSTREKVYIKKQHVNLPEIKQYPSFKTLPGSGLNSLANYERSRESRDIFSSVKFEECVKNLITKYAPPSLIIDKDGEILHVFGDAGAALTFSGGTTSFNVHYCLPKPILRAWQILIDEERKTDFSSEDRDLEFKTQIEGQEVTLSRIHYRVSDNPIYMFTIGTAVEVKPQTVLVEDSNALDSTRVIKSLESEVEGLRRSLSSTVNDLQVANEELQSSNEELVASNEELQVTNEELQSVNEELVAVNSEYEESMNETISLLDDEKSIIASTDIGLVFLDAGLTLRKYSPSAEFIFRLIPSDIGRPFRVTSVDFSEDLLKCAKLVGDTGRSIDIDVEFQSRKWFNFRFSRAVNHSQKTVSTNSDRRSYPVVISFFEISETQILRAKIDQAMSQIGVMQTSLSEGFFEFDLQNRKFFLADYWKNVLDLPSTQEQFYPREFLIPESLQSLSIISADNATSKEVVQLELCAESVNSHRKHWIFLKGAYIELESSKKSKFSGIMFDISKFKNIELELEQKTIDLERTNLFLKQYAFIVSHDFRAPVRHLKRYLNQLSASIQDKNWEAAENLYSGAVQVVSRMSVLIDDITRYSKVSTHENKYEVFDVSVLVKRVYSNLVEIFPKSKLECHELPSVCGDQTMIELVFENLLTNAFKYNMSEKPTVVVKMEEYNGKSYVSVKDNGIGFAEDFSEVIFKPFKRLVSREQFEGSGIGLAICKSVVESHGGSIVVISEEGKGSTFLLNFADQVVTL